MWSISQGRSTIWWHYGMGIGFLVVKAIYSVYSYSFLFITCIYPLPQAHICTDEVCLSKPQLFDDDMFLKMSVFAELCLQTMGDNIRLLYLSFFQKSKGIMNLWNIQLPLSNLLFFVWSHYVLNGDENLKCATCELFLADGFWWTDGA